MSWELLLEILSPLPTPHEDLALIKQVAKHIHPRKTEPASL